VSAPQEEYQLQHRQAGVPREPAISLVGSDIQLTNEALIPSHHKDLAPSHEESRSSKAN